MSDAFIAPWLAVQVRKLEFLLAEALDQGHDCVITIGAHV